MGTASPTFNLISSNDVEGTTVYDPSGTKIGEIDHLMIDKVSGNVRYAVMSFGGFWGLGHSHYPLPWNALDMRASHTRKAALAVVVTNALNPAPIMVRGAITRPSSYRSRRPRRAGRRYPDLVAHGRTPWCFH
jgi:hypothetical protein